LLPKDGGGRREKESAPLVGGLAQHWRWAHRKTTRDGIAVLRGYGPYNILER
jgi:hypothetical protein